MKVLRRRNLFGLLFAVLLSLPLIGIASRCIYVQSNKNAKDSYSGDTTYEINYKYQSNEVNSASDLVVGNLYEINFDDMYIDELINYSEQNYSYALRFIKVYNFSFENYGMSIADINNYNENLDIPLSFEFNSQYNGYLLLPTSSIVGGNDYYMEYDFEDALNDATFTIKGLAIISNLENISVFQDNQVTKEVFKYTDYNEIESVDIDTSGTLDNSFEYSIKKIIDDENLGKINFFTWFEDMFLDSSNSANNLYVHFANWYMNYALLISLVYILFLVLMWFVNFVRKLLERGMSFGEGSY